MLVLRCTQKLLRRVGPTGPPETASTTRLGDWFASLVSVGHQRFVLLVAERTRLPVLVRAREVKRLHRHLVDALPLVLRALGVPDAAVRAELDEMGESVFAKTNNRSVVGTLTDFSFAVQIRMENDPGADLIDVSLWLSDTPILPLDDFPNRMTLKAFETTEQSRMPTQPGPRVRAYRLKVTLIDSHPPIWRRIEVPADISLAGLHRVLQIAMGWTNSHLHEFEKDRVAYGVSDREFGVQRVSEKKTRLGDLLVTVGSRLDYLYDFGDCWEHRVVLEEVVEADGPVARVLEGKRARPPEDVGGIGGYDAFLKLLTNPKHRDHKEMLEWSGGVFDAEAYDIDAANRALGRLRFK